MRRTLLIVLVCIGVGVELGVTCKLMAQTARPKKTTTPQESSLSNVQTARALLATAQMYLEANDYAAAQRQILKALETAPDDVRTQTDAKKYWLTAHEQANAAKQATIRAEAAESERKKRKRHALLEEAKRWAAQDETTKAAELALEVLKETDNEEQVKIATKILIENHPTPLGWQSFVHRAFAILVWGGDILLSITLLFVLYWLLKFARWIWAKSRSCEWVVDAISDTTGLGLGEVIIDLLSQWSTRSAPAPVVPWRLEWLQPTATSSIKFTQRVDISPALESLSLQIGSVSLGGIAKALASIRGWFNATRPWIRGNVVLSDPQVTVRLTCLGMDSNNHTIVSSAMKAESTRAAESVSYKMYYLITQNSTLTEAEAANRLREGMDLLEQYLAGRDSQNLEAAYNAFRSARTESQKLREAYLYEGIALDLLEKHDEAIKRFQYLAQPDNTQDENLREKAQYNEAVAHFRKYSPTELDKAIIIVDDLVGAVPDYNAIVQSSIAKYPTKIMALGVKANAVAHRPIFWQEILCGGAKSNDTYEKLQRKARSKVAVGEWVSEVERITAGLENVLKEAQKGLLKAKNGETDTWEKSDIQRLRWAIQNARGNVYLNYARYFLAELPDENEQKERRACLEKAYDAFLVCEMLLPPGVETLSNLATVAAELDHREKARNYLQQAISLNPNYEYAYYRMAQSWEKENKTDKVVEVLKSFAKDKSPNIPGFREFYLRYAKELAVI